MSEPTFIQPTETVAEGQEHTDTPEVDLEQYPSDHPLVRTLAAQKAQLKELRELGELKKLKEFQELKTKASRFDELQESQKSETEKTAERIAKAEAELNAIPAKVSEVLRAHLIDLHGFDQEDAELFLTATEPDLLLKQADRLVGQSGKRNKNIVPREGRNPNPNPTDPTRDFLRSINGQ